ncbi:hypothetical protein ACQPVP_10915 [Clostridium nigeriense]|uniref:hypothetical protein n=1 Tax=Clostridium nigeriense TaxID=1805470 RepID=UPI003D341BCB
MRDELIKKLLEEYKETEKALELGIDWLNEKDYAKGKLDLVKVIIKDLEQLSETSAS